MIAVVLSSGDDFDAAVRFEECGHEEVDEFGEPDGLTGIQQYLCVLCGAESEGCEPDWDECGPVGVVYRWQGPVPVEDEAV